MERGTVKRSNHERNQRNWPNEKENIIVITTINDTSNFIEEKKVLNRLHVAALRENTNGLNRRSLVMNFQPNQHSIEREVRTVHSIITFN